MLRDGPAEVQGGELGLVVLEAQAAQLAQQAGAEGVLYTQWVCVRHCSLYREIGLVLLSIVPCLALQSLTGLTVVNRGPS